MAKNERKKFLRLLHARRLELESITGDREALAVDASPDELDRIQNASVRELAIGHLERESSRLRDVRAAIRRIESGAFGICADCDQEIGGNRLTAVPWASLCIACQRTEEHRSEPSEPGSQQFMASAA